MLFWVVRYLILIRLWRQQHAKTKDSIVLVFLGIVVSRQLNLDARIPEAFSTILLALESLF